MRMFVAAALAATITAVPMTVAAQEMRARLGHVFAVDSPVDQASRAFAERVAAETGGAVTITVFPDNQLGGDEALGRDLSRGGLEFAFLNPGSLTGLHPLLDIHYLPFIASDFDQVDRIFYNPEGVLQTTLRETLDGLGMTGLAFFELEFRSVTNSQRPVESVEDLAGLRLRVPGSAAILGFFEAAGAQAITMPFPELFVALQQGTVDGQDNGASITYNSRLFEAQRYMTPVNHVYAMGTITASNRAWARLSEEQRATITRIAEEVAAEQIAANRAANATFFENIAAGGVAVHTLSPEAMAGFVEVGQSLWDQLAGVYGAERVEALRAEVAAARTN
ncbi:MAG: TRAP transporter substrate-binding protein [Alkalilacustris sp.]